MGLESLKDKLTKLGADTKSSVQKMSEQYQINTKLTEEKKALDTLLAQLGAAVFDKMQEAPIPGLEDLTEKLDAISTARKAVAGLEEQIQKLKGTTVCPACGKEAARTEKFCSACGAKLPEEETAQPEEECAQEAGEEAQACCGCDEEEKAGAGEEAAEKIKKDAREVGMEVGDIVNEAADKARSFFESVADKAGAFIDGVSSRLAKENAQEEAEDAQFEEEETAVEEEAASEEEAVEETGDLQEEEKEAAPETAQGEMKAEA